ncbi:hypothetical protein E2F43_15820 [Seongchinamella unica]|uniref:Uncharacterized protein n=1 Tax=Seongchinamella unica TaxID=2547392 RepID=A0A4R5LNF7_9GAMM|nr:hypothetical protein [Seongchinamella unica]TDG11836.1 hypothetical protein E2F43_15820 [Seongchinamella unica]
MSSFATNAVCAHKPLCARDSIEQAVATLQRALEESTSQEPAGSADLDNLQLKLKLVRVQPREHPAEASS